MRFIFVFLQLVVASMLYALHAAFGFKPALFALDPEIWSKYVVRNIFDSIQFLNYSRNADDFVMNGKVVHIPQGGAASGVKRNRKILPAVVKQRTDRDITYALDEYTTDPRLMVDAEKVLSYDKWNDMMRQDMDFLKESMAVDMLWRWAKNTPSTGKLRTTGSARAAALGAFGAIGNRKALKIADVISASEYMAQQNLSGDNVWPLDFKMYHDLLSEMSANDQRDFLTSADHKKGILGKLYGFTFMMRNVCTIFDNSGTPVINDPVSLVVENENAAQGWSYEVEADYNSGSVFWNRNWVERAMGEVKLFDEYGNPVYYGDIYSMLARLGGRAISDKGVGVGVMIEAATA